MLWLKQRWWSLVACAGLVVVGLLVAAEVFARVGGGSSYGGGGSSGGGGGGGDGDLIVFLIWLCIKHPAIGVPVTTVVIVVWVVKNRRAKARALPDSTRRSYNRQVSGTAARQRQTVRSQQAGLLQDDPNFSEILFLDFAQLLYTRFQEARGGRDIAGMAPYLSEDLLQQLKTTQSSSGQDLSVEEVVIGSLTIERVADMRDAWQIFCVVEANYTEVRQGGSKRDAFYTEGRLVFRRAKGVLSKGPDEILNLGCPSCGSPVKSDQDDICAHCKESLRSGLFHWELTAALERTKMPRIQARLQPGGVEVGTDFPTLYDPELDVNTKSFNMRYSGESLAHLIERAHDVFVTLQQAWTSGRWEKARAFETDRLFQMHTFWMDRYRDKGWRNVLENVQVDKVVLAKLSRDAFYEIATLRIYASMIDYTVDRQGKVLGGSQTTPRPFSEYWTFVRRAGFTPGQDTDTQHCPSCGAEMKVAMNGKCEYCESNVASGDFDWTLAKIEQDESYAG